MKKVAIFIPLIALLLCSCAGPQLPEKRTPDFNVRLSEGGGMTPESFEIFIHKDSSYYEHNYRGHSIKFYFHTENIEMDKLWNTLRTNFFLQIKTRSEGEVYDRGGTTIQVNWDKNTHNLSNSGNAFVEPAWEEHYNAIVTAVSRLPEMNLAKKYLDIPLVIRNKCPQDTLKQFQYSFDGMAEKSWGFKPGEVFTETTEILHLLPASYGVFYSSQAGIHSPYKEDTLNLTDSIRQITFEIYPDKIELIKTMKP